MVLLTDVYCTSMAMNLWLVKIHKFTQCLVPFCATLTQYSVCRLNRSRINRIFAYNGGFLKPKIYLWSKSRRLNRISVYNGENSRSRALRYKRRTLYISLIQRMWHNHRSYFRNCKACWIPAGQCLPMLVLVLLVIGLARVVFVLRWGWLSFKKWLFLVA